MFKDSCITIDLGKRIHISLLLYSKNNKYLICANEDEGIIVIEDFLFKPIIRVFEHKEWIKSLTISDDSKYVISGDSVGFIVVWDIETGQKKLEFKLDDSIEYLLFHKNLYSTSFSDEVCIWDIETGNLIKTLKPSEKVLTRGGDYEVIEYMSFSLDQKYLITTGRYATRIWDIEKYKEMSTLEISGSSAIFNQNSTQVIIGRRNEILFYTFDLETLLYKIEENTNSSIDSLIIRPDGKYFSYIPSPWINKDNLPIRLLNFTSLKSYDIPESGIYFASISFDYNNKYFSYVIEDNIKSKKIKIFEFAKT